MSGSVGFIGHGSAAQVAVVQDPLIARLGPIVELSSGSPDVRVAIIDGPVDAGALGQARLRQIRSTQGVDDKTSHVARDHGTAVVELLAAPGSGSVLVARSSSTRFYDNAQRRPEYRSQP
jgi:hypothetical protein